MAHLLPVVKARFVDSNGDPLVGGKVYTYQAGTSTPLATYTDKGAGTPNANPVILDSRGEADIWLDSSNYKITVHDSSDALIWTVDNVKSVNDGSIVAAMLASDSVTTAKIADGAITFAKLGSGVLGNANHTDITSDYTVLVSDEIVLVDAQSGDLTITLPSVASAANKIITIKRVDNTDIFTDVCLAASVSVANDTFTMTSHPFSNLDRVQLTTTSALPTGLSLATDYYIIYVDANTVKFATSRANAQVGTAIDLTSQGTGAHTVTSENNIVTIDGHLSETIDGDTTITLQHQHSSRRLFCDGNEWFILSVKNHEKAYSLSDSSGVFSSTSTTGEDVTNLSQTVNITARRPVLLMLIPTASSAPGVGMSSSSAETMQATISFERDGDPIASYNLYIDLATGDGIDQIRFGSVFHVDFPNAAGSYTYNVEVGVASGTTINITNMKLLVTEL